MNKTWLIANLEDTRVELQRAIDEIRCLDSQDEHIAQQLIGEVFLKLNFAWNARHSNGNEADGKYADWIQYPKVMDIYSGSDRKTD